MTVGFTIKSRSQHSGMSKRNNNTESNNNNNKVKLYKYMTVELQNTKLQKQKILP
jgi:hypothetical protein